MRATTIAKAAVVVVVSAAIVAVLVVAVPRPVEAPRDPPVRVPDSASVRFTASGDFSSSPEALSVFDAIGEINPDLHLALGDLSYGTAGAEQQWCTEVTRRVGAGFPFELVSGNHESNGDNGNIGDFAACLPNQLPGVVGTYGREYYVDVPVDAPLVRFVMISPGLTFADGEWSYAEGTTHYDWTAAVVDGAHAAGIPWVVVGMHKSCVSIGRYACDPGTELISMLVDKRADLVLSGHEHLYERSKQLATLAACPSLVADSYNAACVANAESTMPKRAGTVFATVGTGGALLRDVNLADPEAGYFAAHAGLNANPTWGSLDVTVTATQLTARFARAAGGTFTDEFTLSASVTPTANGASSQAAP